MLLELTAHDVAQRHLGGADLRADHLEPPGDGGGLVGDGRVGERASEVGVLGHRRDDGHEVRLTGAVVADDQEPLVVAGLVELQLREDQLARAARPCGRR